MMGRIPAIATASLFLFGAVSLAQAADDIRVQRVQFDSGANSAFIEDAITGYEIVDYVLRANAGQYMNVSMATDNTANYFNVMEPGEDGVAIFIGSTVGNQYEGTLAETGDYTVRVYMMRSAARRGEVANYRLEVIVDGPADQASAPSTGDALVPGTEFHATGILPCAHYLGQPMTQCDFGVIREGGGNATVVFTHPGGETRAIYFEAGEVVGADISQADGDLQITSSKEAGLYMIRIGDERYEVVDAVIYGG